MFRTKKFTVPWINPQLLRPSTVHLGYFKTEGWNLPIKFLSYPLIAPNRSVAPTAPPGQANMFELHFVSWTLTDHPWAHERLSGDWSYQPTIIPRPIAFQYWQRWAGCSLLKFEIFPGFGPRGAVDLSMAAVTVLCAAISPSRRSVIYSYCNSIMPQSNSTKLVTSSRALTQRRKVVEPLLWKSK